MHRTFRVPRLVGFGSLVAALALLVGIYTASAQNQQQGVQNAQHIELRVGSTRACSMTTRADLKRVENPNSKVLRVERIADKNNEILLVAENPGTTQITLTDQTGRVEVHEITVVAASAVQPDVAKPVKIYLMKGEQVTRQLEKAPLGGYAVSAGDVVDILVAKTEPKSIVFRGLNPGIARVTFFGDKEKKEIVGAFEIEVPIEDRVKQLRELIKKLAPNDTVEVHPLIGSRATMNREGVVEKETTVAVMLTGTVASADTVALIVKAAEALFPPTLISQQTNEMGVNVQTAKVDQLNVINQIRIRGVHQVQLEVVVAIVNRSDARNMSFSWTVNGTNAFGSSFFGPPYTFASLLSPASAGSLSPPQGALQPTGGYNAVYGVLNSRVGFLAFLQALKTEGLTKILAEPRVITMSGEQANILSGGETPLLTSSGTGGPTVSYKQFGTVVNAIPRVKGNKIHMDIKAEISDVDTSLGISIPGITPTIVPGFRTRSAQAAIELEDGQTLAIGGLIQNNITASISRAPILGELPYVGMLFSQKTYTETEQELLILVTPRLVDPVDCTKLPKWLPGRETRSPDDFELFMEGILEAPRGPRQVGFHPHTYKGAHTLAPNAGEIPCATGNCGNRYGAGCVNGNCTTPNGVANTQRNLDNVPIFAQPTPSFPNVPATPASRPNVTLEPDAPVVPAGPTSSVPLAPRQLENRPLLPPIGR